MRQLFVQVPSGSGHQVAAVAQRHNAVSVVQFEGTRNGEPHDVVLLHLSNREVEGFLEDMQALDGLHVSYIPKGVIALKPPAQKAVDQVTDVTLLSPIEVFLAGHQSVGSWRGFLGYAAAAAVVVWIALFTDTAYLLTAAMLIAPFAGPAMNAAISTASGDVHLFRRSLLRYGAALMVTISAAALLSLLLGPEAPTPQMISQSQISSVSVLLPLVAGAAGAVHLFQSERSSLVSGAAVGMLVAASLAPPAGLVGMAAALGRWDMAANGAFVLVLQLVGINAAGAVAFRVLGLKPKGVRYETASARFFPIGLASSVLLLGGLLYIQFSEPIRLQRSSTAQRVATEMLHVLEQHPLVTPIEVSAHFSRAHEGEETVVGNVLVLPYAKASVPDTALHTALVSLLQRRVKAQWPTVTPLINLTVLTPPPEP